MQNTAFLSDKTAQVRASVDDGAKPPPPLRRPRAKLQTVGDVSRELSKLYRQARSGKIDVADASRLANMLSILSRILESSELEKRVEALEGKQGRLQ